MLQLPNLKITFKISGFLYFLREVPPSLQSGAWEAPPENIILQESHRLMPGVWHPNRSSPLGPTDTVSRPFGVLSLSFRAYVLGRAFHGCSLQALSLNPCPLVGTSISGAYGTLRRQK